MRTLRTCLDEIEAMIMDGAVGSYLWDVLAALRGPDNDVGKNEITIPIRRAAFPNISEDFANSISNCPIFTSEFSHDNPNTIKIEVCQSHHFAFHGKRAAKALRLTIKEN